mgnify:CR=1 FL=1
MTEDLVLSVWLAEYDKLKTEQIQRIGFRDNLLYVTLGVFGAVISFAVSNTANYYAFLVVPWACIVLGWTYLVNDEKISAIGRYIRLTLVEKVKEKSGYADLEALFGWEISHRSDRRRSRRKIEQLIIDEITFVFAGIVALIAFWILVPNAAIAIYILSGIEFLLLVVLGWEIIVYADLAKGR